MRIKLPKLFCVGDTVYTLRRVKRIKDIPDTKTLETIGMCDPSQHEILLRCDLRGFAELEAFIHEILHGFEAEYDFAIPHWLVYRIAKGLAHFIIDNQWS